MKRKLSIVLAVIMLFAVMLAGCGGSKSSKFEGEWKLSGAEMAGVKVEADGLSQFGEATIKFEGKKVTMTMGGETKESEWTEKDGVATITEDGNSVDLTIEDSKLVFEYSGVKMYFEKVK
jgi:hypothetical protein